MHNSTKVAEGKKGRTANSLVLCSDLCLRVVSASALFSVLCASRTGNSTNPETANTRR